MVLRGNLPVSLVSVMFSLRLAISTLRSGPRCHRVQSAPFPIPTPIMRALIEALVGCLCGGSVREDRLAQRHHSLILRRFRRAVEENSDQPLYIPELCGAIGVS